MKKFRVAEIFGPTIQGEGRHVGVPCHFIRFGGCDYRCAWCDSLHAVLPEHTKHLPRLTEEEIIYEVCRLPQTAKWIVYSGGNPAMLNLMDLTCDLQEAGFKVMVETQGTQYQPYLAIVDELCVSPKGPSAQIGTAEQSLGRLQDFMRCQGIRNHHSVYLKVPVFDEPDYLFAKEVHFQYPEIEMFLSVGNPLPPTGLGDSVSRPLLRETLLSRTNELIQRTLKDGEMADVRIFPQQHCLIWGNDRGR